MEVEQKTFCLWQRVLAANAVPCQWATLPRQAIILSDSLDWQTIAKGYFTRISPAREQVIFDFTSRFDLSISDKIVRHSKVGDMVCKRDIQWMYDMFVLRTGN